MYLTPQPLPPRPPHPCYFPPPLPHFLLPLPSFPLPSFPPPLPPSNPPPSFLVLLTLSPSRKIFYTGCRKL